MLPIFNEYSSMLQDFGIELPYSPEEIDIVCNEIEKIINRIKRLK